MHFLFLGAAWWVAAALQAAATVICQGTIEQPINLAGASNPASIPLGLAAYESNHGYGIQGIITAPRPCLHGAMTWPGGTELDQNLAHVFGISVEYDDPTQVTAGPVVIRVKAQPRPPYSPYTKAQVVAATLHCLLRSVYATPEHPLEIQLATDNPEDRQWAEVFAGKYVNASGSQELQITPTPVPGTRLETDVYGVTHVIFSDVPQGPALPARPPVLIPFRPEGENDDVYLTLFPVWVGDTWHDRLEAIGEPYALFHDLWRGHGSPEVNALLRSGNSVEWGVQETPEKTAISIGFAEISNEDLAAAIYAVIISVQPTAEKPLEIQLQPHLDATAIAAFVAGSPGWEDGSRCVFVFDPKTRKLLRGSVPGLTVAADGTGGISLMKSEPSPADVTAERERDLYENLYQQQVLSKDFEPTLEEFRKFSPEGKQEGLVWESWRAGYREAFFAYRELTKLHHPPAAPPLESIDHLGQTRDAGWRAGNARGFKIASDLWAAYQKESKDPPPTPEPEKHPLPDESGK
jgi:hypothetical protein